MTIYGIIVMAFVNGNFVDADLLVGASQPITEKLCPVLAERAIEAARTAAGPDVQFVAKCVDLEQLPTTVSAFGSKAK